LNFLIILISFLLSTIISLQLKNKTLSMVFALIINTVILMGSAWLLYVTNEEARYFGFEHTNLYILIFSIPVITWLNYMILTFKKVKN
jgi:hypothetical protein